MSNLPKLPKTINEAIKDGEILVEPLAISEVTTQKGEDIIYNGMSQNDIIEQNLSISQLVAVLWKGKTVSGEEEEFLRQIIILTADHGPEVISTFTTIMAASGGINLPQAVASGLSQVGPKHGGAAGEAAKWFSYALEHKFSPEKFLGFARENIGPIPGIGHKKYNLAAPDPRVKKLVGFIRKNKWRTPVLDYALEVEKLTIQKQDNLILNIDGVIGAVLYDLDYPLESIDGFFVFARTIGLIAHYIDQKKRGAPLIRLPEWLIFKKDNANA